MSKPIIAIDVDDVLSSQVDAIITFSNERYGTQLTPDDFKKPGEYWGYFRQVWDIPPEESNQRFKVFLDEQHYTKQVIDPAAALAIAELKKTFSLQIVTSRFQDHVIPTEAWLLEHAPSVFDGLHFVHMWDRDGFKATKAHICREIGAGYLIDDSTEHCNLAAEAGVRALLFGEYGWNITEQLHSGVVRVKDWDAVLEYFGGKS